MLYISTGTVAEVQQAIDNARAANPARFIVINLVGTYSVSATPLMLSSREILYLNGTIQASSPSAVSPALVFVNPGQSFVAIIGAGNGGRLDGLGANLCGVKVSASSRVVLDGLAIQNTGREGLSLEGPGKTVWDAQFAVTRCEVSGCGTSGILLTNVNQSVLVDNISHDNSGSGIVLCADNTAVAGNICARNYTDGLNVSGTGNTLYHNTFDGNATGVNFTGACTNSRVAMNIIRNNTVVGIALAGSSNTVFDNRYSGDVANLSSRGANNIIIPTLGPLNGTGNKYFYPPTARNPHADTLIAIGKGRFDLTISSNTTIADVQQQYNAAKAVHPNDVIVLHLTGSLITAGATPLTLSSYTCVLLGPTTRIVANGATTAAQVITATGGATYISVSGGMIDGGGSIMRGIEFINNAVTLIDGVTLKNFGAKQPRSDGTDVIHLSGGGVAQIVRGCTIDNSGARGIWTQKPSSRFIIADNEISNCNMDGIDFDSFTRFSLAVGNFCHDNGRYGIFIEEGAQLNQALNNHLLRNAIGVNLYANVVGPTNYNGVFCNVIESNRLGLRNGALRGVETSHNYLFNNVVQHNTEYGINAQLPGTENYYCENVLYDNAADHWSAVTVFFNPSQAVIGKISSAAPKFAPPANPMEGRP